MILDLIIILVILLFTFLGYKKGLIKTAIGILSFFIALIITMCLYKTVGNIIIEKTQVDENIENVIISKIEIEDIEEKYEILPDSLIETGKTTIQELAENLTQKIIYIASFIILFIALRIVLIFAKFLAGIIAKIPVIKQVDKLRRNNMGISKRLYNSNSSICNNTTCITNDRRKIYKNNKRINNRFTNV